MEKRIIDIESKLVFAEKTIEDLSEELYEHQKKISQLEAGFLQLKQQLTTHQESTNVGTLEDEVPPHY